MSRLFLAAAAALLSLLTGAASAQTAELPVPCVAGVCGANIPGFVTSGRANATIINNTLRVTQQTDRSILNWASFNVGADGKVIFDQPGPDSIALNRIFQGSPSKILGAIEANGQIYLINQNGFMFGPTARVRTAGLMVSSLNMLDSTFDHGLVSPDLLQNAKPALESDGRVGVLDPQGNPVLGDDGKPLEVKITIAPGAQLSTLGKGGRVMLASRTVDNAGAIDAPDGQVLVAAGEKVYLQASSDPALRGLLVEVDAGGDAWNRMTGNITAARGNVTMVGLAVNQLGRVSASTSVSANGSVRLLARDSARVTFDASQNPVLAATRGGTLELGAASQTTVLPELGDPTTAVDEQKQLASSVELQGRQVFVRGGAVVRAKGGNISLRALNDPDSGLTRDPEARVRVESGAVLDASGSDATAPVSRNVVSVELRGNELRDAPLQRNGPLRGQTVFVDARVGTALADVTGAIAGIGRTVDERTSAGGNISVDSFGDVAVSPGAIFDVSGGKLTYTGGAVQTTQLIKADGSTVDIGQAKPDQLYTGLINPSAQRRFDRWGVTEQVQGPLIGRYEPGYVEGKSAGTLQFTGRALQLDGKFLGGVTIGPNQRDAARAPLGGRFIVGSDLAPGSTLLDYRAPSIDLVTQSTPTSVGDNGSLPQRPLELPTDFLTSGGFTRTELYSNGLVYLPETMMLTLAPGSSLRITAQRVDALGDVSAPGGSIRLASVLTIGVDNAAQPRYGVELGPASTLDVRGLWNNELSLLTPIYRDGGQIDLAVRALGGELVLGDGAALLADGGASMAANGSVTGGKGGSIGLHAGAGQGAIETGEGVRLSAFGVAGASGGSFTLEVPRLQVVADDAWSRAQRVDLLNDAGGFFTLGDGLFADSGFASFDLAATGPRFLGDVVPRRIASASPGDAPPPPGHPETLVIRSGAHLDARARTLQLDSSAATRPSGGTVGSFASAVLAPDYQRAATSVSLRVDPHDFAGADNVGRLVVEAGSEVRVDARGSVKLSSLGDIEVGGSIIAPGGSVTASIPTPVEAYDQGYRAQLGISFLDSARVDVAGITLLKPSDVGLLTGDVLDGGSVSLLADRGFVRAAAGASFDLRGASSGLDIAGAGANGGYLRRTIGGAGGSLTVRSPESLDFASTVRAQAGAGDTPSAGGSATLQLTRQRGFSAGPSTVADTFSTAPRTLLVTNDPGQISGDQNGIGVIDAGWVRAAGFDALDLEAGDRIEFYAGADLSLARALQVSAPLIGVSGDAVKLTAPYLSFGTQVEKIADTPAPISGFGRLDVSGDLIEFTGRTTLTGVAQASFTAASELRLRGFEFNGQSTGELHIAGDLSLSAPLIYPTTLTQFSIVASGGLNDRVRFISPQDSTATPYSVGGSLNVQARSIEQGGRVLAPFGQISLNASDDLTLASGSVTSVSANGNLLPFGSVQAGTDWVYGLGATLLTDPHLAAPSVSLNARDLTLAQGSTVDLKGGGDLYAYEWAPGTGGSRDALAPGVVPGLYAILPSLRGGFAPFDPQEYQDSDLQPGDSVYLSGVAGLPAGVYPLLPARYALLPGAMLVSAVPGTIDATPGATTLLPDGTPVVAGYRTFSGTNIRDARYSGFAVRPGSYARSLATYQDSLASTFDEKQRPVAPDDAARLALQASRTLDLAGGVLTAANAKGAGSSIDVAAPNLVLRAAGAADVADAVNVDAPTLAGWKAASLLLGGRRDSDGRTVDVTASRVTLGPGVQLSGTEIIAVARDQLTLSDGATLASTGGIAAPEFADEAPLVLDGDSAGAAVLGVSGTRALNVQRGAVGARGAIVAAAGSRIASSGSLLIDAPASVEADGTLAGQGATWTLGSGEIVFGGAAVAQGLNIDDSMRAALGGAGRLRLSATDAVSFAESLTLGSLGEIIVDAPTLRASAPGVNAHLAANSVTLLNSSVTQPAAPGTTGSGALSFSADDLVIGPGSLAVDGFANLDLAARHEILGDGTARVAVAGDVSLTAANIGARSDADLQIDAQGTLRTSTAGTALADATRQSTELGGRVALSARDIEHAGVVRVGSGRIELQAANSLTLDAGSRLDASGATVTAAGRALGSSGGDIRLSAGGSLAAASGAVLDVSGAGDTDAGTLGIVSSGTATFGATLLAHSVSGARGGSFAATLGSLAEFDLLNDALESGGFTESRRVDVGAGDLTLGAGHALTAHDVQLHTGGVLTVAGRVDASSDNQRGNIELDGDGGLVLAPGASLVARGLGALGRGGSATLASAAGDVTLSAGSSIALDGSQEAGRLTLRAAATADGLRLDTLGATVSGVDVIALQPVLEFELDANPAAADFNAIRTQVSNWANVASPAIRARFASSATPVAVRPGIDLVTDGDLSLGSLDLSSWGFAGEAATLAFRATGAIDITGTVSDGFQAIGTGSAARVDLVKGNSSSLRFEAGTDLRLDAGARVRTGTGDLILRAANDVFFDVGATAFTAGTAGAPTRVFGRGASYSLPTGGGRLLIDAGHDVLGSPVTQSVTDWEVRQSKPQFSPASDPGWGTDLRLFGWNAGTLGGGDLTVRAGHDIRDLSAAAADSAALLNGTRTSFGGGVLQLDAGNDVTSAYLHVTRGDNRVRAGGAIGTSREDPNSGETVASLLSIQEGSVDLVARRGIELETAINPTALTQTQQGTAFRSYFLSYAPDSTLRVRSATGDVQTFGTRERLIPYLGNDVVTANEPAMLSLMPPNVELRATDGDLLLSGDTTMMASDNGQAQLFASHDIVRLGGTFTMSDAAAASLPTALDQADSLGFQSELAHQTGASGRHLNDDLPVLINAGRDIVGAFLLLPKMTRVAAGRDVRDVAFLGQNLRATDATLITAGRDVVYDLDGGNAQISLGGPGRLDVIAGRDVDLGFSAGISSVGRLVNPALATDAGANITVLAGVGQTDALDVLSFVTRVVSPQTNYRAALQSFVAGVTGSPADSFDAAVASFEGFAADLQRAFLLPVFFSELDRSGHEANEVPGAGYTRGYAAIDALFPGSREPGDPPKYQGDIKLAFSRIYTLADADISLLAPGGLLNVGLANPPAGLVGTRKPSELGIVAQRAGSVRIFTNDDVLVNQSRVFTLRGGDILIWSTAGDIDAGRGAKSAISAPPPTVLVDPSGRVTLDFAGAVAGSGIRGILTDPDVKPGSVNLIAPKGIVDAGDAGIGSAGNLNVAAQQVVGLDNIQVGGTSTGVPAETSSLGASLSGASAVASSASSAAGDNVSTSAASQAVAPLADSALGFLDVFLEGFGADVCKADDNECLQKNQK